MEQSFQISLLKIRDGFEKAFMSVNLKKPTILFVDGIDAIREAQPRPGHHSIRVGGHPVGQIAEGIGGELELVSDSTSLTK